MRAQLPRLGTNFLGGINQQAEPSLPNQCVDALNVWAPGGKLEKRPGYVGLYSLLYTFTGGPVVVREEDVPGGTFDAPGGTGLLTLDSAAAEINVGDAVTQDGDRIYIGRTAGAFNGVRVEVTSANTNLTQFYAEYWNGSAWTYLPVANWSGTPTRRGALFTAVQNELFSLVPPGDWAATTVNSVSAHWIRLTLKNASIGICEIDVDTANTGYWVDSPGTLDIVGMGICRFPNGKRFWLIAKTSSSLTSIVSVANILWDGTIALTLQSIDPYWHQLAEPPSVAVVPEFNEFFVAYDQKVARLEAFPSAAPSTTDFFAQVENRSWVLDDPPNGAGLGPNRLVQLAEFPPAKYVMWFQSRLWAVVGKTVRWSAASVLTYGHRVWPAQNYENITSEDDSDITGLSNVNEQPVVFTSDTINILTNVGLSPVTEQPIYDAVPVVVGVGCTSNSSIKKIRGRLIFLGEDGIYAFDGTPNIKKVTEDPRTGADRLADIWGRISPGMRKFAVAAHWKAKKCYLLSVVLDGGGSTSGSSFTPNPTHVIVWQYDRDIWWVWDNIPAAKWLEDENGEQEVLYFGDNSGQFYQFDVGRHDHGTAITAYAKSHRLHFPYEAIVAEAEVQAEQLSRSITARVYVNDDPTGTLGNGSAIDLTSANELDYGDTGAVNGGSYVTPRRRLGRFDTKLHAQWCQIEVRHTEKSESFKLITASVGYTPDD